MGAVLWNGLHGARETLQTKSRRTIDCLFWLHARPLTVLKQIRLLCVLIGILSPMDAKHKLYCSKFKAFQGPSCKIPWSCWTVWESAEWWERSWNLQCWLQILPSLCGFVCWCYQARFMSVHELWWMYTSAHVCKSFYLRACTGHPIGEAWNWWISLAAKSPCYLPACRKSTLVNVCMCALKISCLSHSVRWDGDPYGTRCAIPQKELQILSLFWGWGWDETLERMLGPSRLQFLCNVNFHILCACVEHSVACACERTRNCPSCTSLASNTVDHVHDEASFDQHEIQDQCVATSLFLHVQMRLRKEFDDLEITVRVPSFVFGSGNPRLNRSVKKRLKRHR